MRALLFVVGAVCIAIAAAGCGGPTRDPGLDAAVRVVNAQFYRGAPPAESGGPTVTDVAAVRSIVQVGTTIGVSGLTPVGTGGLVAYARGDVGYWVFTPGIRNVAIAGQLDFAASMQIARTVPTDRPLQIDVYAVGTDGAVGPARLLELTAVPPPIPDGKLVVSLDWDQQVDLDLHVTDPNGIEIWARKINSFQAPPPPALPGPDDYENGGILDYDSNASCVLDGRRQENVVWAVDVPLGAYVVRVDTFSMCGQGYANWHLRVVRDGQLLDEARGVATELETRFPHGAGAGEVASVFTVSE
jgi:hypothetical protein